MDVSAIAQGTQGQPAAAAQDSSSASASAMFSYLLKHQFDGKQDGGSLINTQPMIDMVGATPAYVPPPTPPAPQATTSSNSNNSQSQSSQSGTGTGSSGASQSGQPVAAVDPNGSNNSNSGAQADSNNAGSQQNSSNSNSSGSNTQTSANAPSAPTAHAASGTGEDATTEATAAVMAGTMHVVQAPPPVKSLAADPTIGAAANLDSHSGPAPTAAGPSAATNAAPAAAAAQAAATSAADDSASEATPWSLNFLASATATTPQMAQQAAGLSKLTGGTSASVSTQTTSGTSVASPSASALVPDAVLAISGFMHGGGQDASTGDGSGNQTAGQQTASGAADATQLDPDAALLAEETQALTALTSTIQTVAQNLAANAALPQAIDAAAAAAPSVATATESAMPLPAAPTSAPANASGFAAQLQEAEQTQAPQANRPIVLPSAIDQIKMQIEKGVAAGSSTIKVQLTPENMGRVEVKLEVQNGSVKATITADRADTLQVLKADQSGLVQSLQDAGLNADSSSLSFFLRGDQQRQFAQSNRQSRDQSNGSTGDDDPLLAGITAASGASSGVGAGNLDISV